MANEFQLKVAATYMRGGTSKGVFFNLEDLPLALQVPGKQRDEFLLRVIGSPDVYGKQIDGMGGATSSTSKTAIISRSTRPDHDVDYLFGQVSIDKPFVDWSGNCGNLSAAVGSFAIQSGLISADRLDGNGIVTVRVWQVNTEKTILIHVPVKNGLVVEMGNFLLDGVAFTAAEIPVDFMEPSSGDSAIFPTDKLTEQLEVPSVGLLDVTMINAGIPTIFVDADSLGYQGTELQDDINSDPKALAMFELIRAHGALKMGLITSIEQATTRQHTPKVAFVSKPKQHHSSSGKVIEEGDTDILVRALSMGKLHHAMMGTAAVAIASAAAIPGTLINTMAGGGERESICFGHPSGTLTVGAKASKQNGHWCVEKVTMSRSARVIMEGWVRVPTL